MQSESKNIEALASALDLILPPRYLHASRMGTNQAEKLLPGEREAATTMKGRRYEEFSTSRILIRELLGVIAPIASHKNTEILPDRDGVPLWPSGFTGSISHSKGICAVVLGKKTAAKQSIGIDIETLGRLSREAKRRICSAAEQQRVEAFAAASGMDETNAYTLVFSAKEAYFKYLYPQTRQWLEFLDVELIGMNGDYLELDLKKSVCMDSLPTRRNVAYRFTKELAVTAVWG